MSDIGGVWRTIGGRRVFIKDGQDLESAMRESGKFKKKYTEEEKAKKLNETMDKRQKIIEKLDKETEDLNEYDKYNLAISKLENEDYSTPTERQYWVGIKERYQKQADEDYKKNRLHGEKKGKDYLPKEKEIKEQGNSNRQEVRENIQAHILDYYDNPVDFMEQMDAMDYLPTKWKAGEELAKGGSYLIYNGDMSEFLDNLKINPKGKSFSEEKAFDMYTSLIGRESEHLYNKLDKLYQQYKADHKNSNVSLDDFRKWFE